MKDQTMKKDNGKVPLELLPEEALEQIALVLKFGAEKYSAQGWREGMEWTRLIGAAKRHLAQWTRDDKPDVDDETGLSHLAHAACCMMFLLTYEQRELGTDDRWAKAAEALTADFSLSEDWTAVSVTIDPPKPIGVHDFGTGPVPAHRHPNGGGWVADTATVDATAYVGPKAKVFGDAQVCGDAEVSGRAQVYEGRHDG